MQKGFLYCSLLIPSCIVLCFRDVASILLFVQLMYVMSMVVYVRYLSLEKSVYPYLSN